MKKVRVTKRQLGAYVRRLLNESGGQGAVQLNPDEIKVINPAQPGSTDKSSKFIIDASGEAAFLNQDFLSVLASGLGAQGGEGNLGQFGEDLLLTLKPFLGNYDRLEDTNKWVGYDASLLGSPTGAGDSFGIDAFAYASGNDFTSVTQEGNVLDFRPIGVGISMKFSTGLSAGSYRKQDAKMEKEEGMVKLACLYGLHWLFVNSYLSQPAPAELRDSNLWVEKTINILNGMGITEIKFKADAINGAPRPQDPLISQDIAANDGQVSFSQPPAQSFYESLKSMIANAEAAFGLPRGSIRIDSQTGAELVDTGYLANLNVPTAKLNDLRNFYPNFDGKDIYKTQAGVIFLGDFIQRMTPTKKASYQSGNIKKVVYNAQFRTFLSLTSSNQRPGTGRLETTDTTANTPQTQLAPLANGSLPVLTINLTGQNQLDDRARATQTALVTVFSSGARLSEQKPVISLVSTKNHSTAVALGTDATVNLTLQTSNPQGIGKQGDLKSPDEAIVEIILPSYKTLNLDFASFVTSAGQDSVDQIRLTTAASLGFGAQSTAAIQLGQPSLSDMFKYDSSIITGGSPLVSSLYDNLATMEAASLTIHEGIQQSIVDDARAQTGPVVGKKNTFLEMMAPPTAAAILLKDNMTLLLTLLSPLVDPDERLSSAPDDEEIARRDRDKLQPNLLRLGMLLSSFVPGQTSLIGKNSIDYALQRALGNITGKLNSPKLATPHVDGVSHDTIISIVTKCTPAVGNFAQLGLLKTSTKLQEMLDSLQALTSTPQVQSSTPGRIYQLHENQIFNNKFLGNIVTSGSNEQRVAAMILKAENKANTLVNITLQTLNLYELLTRAFTGLSPSNLGALNTILTALNSYLDGVVSLLQPSAIVNNPSDILDMFKDKPGINVPDQQSPELPAPANQPFPEEELEMVAESRLYEAILTDLMEASSKKQRAANQPKKLKLTKRRLNRLLKETIDGANDSAADKIGRMLSGPEDEMNMGITLASTFVQSDPDSEQTQQIKKVVSRHYDSLVKQYRYHNNELETKYSPAIKAELRKDTNAFGYEGHAGSSSATIAYMALEDFDEKAAVHEEELEKLGTLIQLVVNDVFYE